MTWMIGSPLRVMFSLVIRHAFLGAVKSRLGSLSTTEAEYKTSSLAAQECVLLRRLIDDVSSPIHNPTTIFGENQSVLKLATNPVCHVRTKHINLTSFYL